MASREVEFKITLPRDDNLIKLVAMLKVEMGRWPTDEEVTNFIFGSPAERADLIRAAKLSNLVSDVLERGVNEMVEQDRHLGES